MTMARWLDQIDLFSLFIITCAVALLGFALFMRIFHWLMSPVDDDFDPMAQPHNVAPFPDRWEPSMSDDGSQEQAR